MNWKARAAAFIKQVGPAAKFAATTAMSVMVPGSPAVIELVAQVLDCATESADQVWHVENDRNTASDLERVGRLLEDMLATMDTTLAQLAALDGLPDAARRIMDVALANDVKLREAGNQLQSLVAGFDRLESQLGSLAGRQEMAIDQQHEMLTWQRLSVGLMLTFYSENTRDPRRREQFRAALAAFGAGRLNDAHPALTALAAELPASAAVHGALGAVQATEHDLPAAQASLVKAARLNPANPALQQLSSKATVALTRLTPAAAAPDAPLHVGDLLGGWEVIQLLGSGGWGQVVKGRKASQVAALKVLHAQLSGDETFQADFRKEMMALMRLGGMRHLAEILDFGFCQQQRRWFFVMAFVEGMSLQTYLDRHGPLPLEAAVACFRPLAEALGKAHALNIVHRDIKPANLLRGADGSLTLVDFGLAGAASDRGTLEFAAPEQLRGGRGDARSDVFSLAATFYKVVTGEHSDYFRHDRIKDRALADLLALSLKANPQERPANAAEFATGLQLGLQTGQQHGEALLAQGYRDALDRNHGDVTKGDKAALGQLCQDHGISRERANTIVREVKVKWDAAAQEQEAHRRRETEQLAEQRRCEELDREDGNWTEEALLRHLENEYGKDSAEVAERLFAWARCWMPCMTYGRASKNGAIFPKIEHRGKQYALFSVQGDGSVKIQFQYLCNKPPFQDNALRGELLLKLNTIPGVAIPTDSDIRYPAIPLRMLSDAFAYAKFLEVAKWFIQCVKET